MSETPVSDHLKLHWLEPGRLGGCARPGRTGQLEADLGALFDAGTRLVISLTEEWQPDLPTFTRCGLRSLWLPVADMTPPTIDQARLACSVAASTLEAGQGVVYHCQAGQGRTGAMLAAQMVWNDLPAQQAIEDLRAVNNAWIETAEQEAFVARFGASLLRARRFRNRDI